MPELRLHVLGLNPAFAFTLGRQGHSLEFGVNRDPGLFELRNLRLEFLDASPGAFKLLRPVPELGARHLD
eukprot:8873489-Alexandrium_andersonii.AAC.1